MTRYNHKMFLWAATACHDGRLRHPATAAATHQVRTKKNRAAEEGSAVHSRPEEHKLEETRSALADADIVFADLVEERRLGDHHGFGRLGNIAVVAFQLFDDQAAFEAFHSG